MPIPTNTMLTAVAALALVLGLVLLAAKVVRRTGLARPGPRTRRLAMQESLALDRARALHIVRCDGRELLLLTGGAEDRCIGWLPGTPAEAAHAGAHA